MTVYTGINHLAMVTDDMEATIHFWRDLLGTRLVAGLGDGKYRHYFFELSPDDMIAFFEWRDAEKIPLKDHGVPVKGPVAFDHVSLGVPTGHDLVDLKKKLETAGFWVSEIIDHGFIHSIYSFDPNHIPIEFSAPVEGVDVRAKPMICDTHPSPAAREGADPVPGRWPEPEAGTPVSDDRVYPGEGRIFSDDCKDRS
jgi:catechol 2,3-dioxygenase-like lactoylglutathione lyase family enzyme